MKCYIFSHRENGAIAVQALDIAGKALLGDFDEEPLTGEHTQCITALTGATPLIST